MNKILISFILITSLMGWAAAFDMENGVEMRPGEAAAENLFNHGIGPAWVGGNPPYSGYYGNHWAHGYDPFYYYSHPGKTYHPYSDPFIFYSHPGKTFHPHTYHYYYYDDMWYPSGYYNSYWWY